MESPACSVYWRLSTLELHLGHKRDTPPVVSEEGEVDFAVSWRQQSLQKLWCWHRVMLLGKVP